MASLVINSLIPVTYFRKLYPEGFDIPDDSDYDNQEDIEPVVTELMPLEKQDPKLRVDYTNLPKIPYVWGYLSKTPLSPLTSAQI